MPITIAATPIACFTTDTIFAVSTEAQAQVIAWNSSVRDNTLRFVTDAQNAGGFCWLMIAH